jgi:hypothetical protein
MMLLLVLVVYLFVSAPAPLPGATAHTDAGVGVRTLLEICAAENDVVREIYTKQIVGAGKVAGLRFDENWRDANVHAGPLPALFLRETAKSLQQSSVRLGLFLGSDYPISQSNRFSDQQADAFRQMRRDRLPRHFFMADIKLHTAMFPDVAVAQACVDCHNEHADSPKRDWKLGDVMGATTWTYPAESVSLAKALELVGQLRKGFHDAYSAYTNKAATFSQPPEIATRWPADGYFLPTPKTFMQAAEERASRATLERLLARR